MHLKRWITGIIGAVFLVVIISMDVRLPFYLTLFMAAIIGVNEFFNVTAKDMPRILRIACGLLTLALFVIIVMKQVLLFPFIIFLFLAVPFLFQMLTYGSPEKRWDRDTMEKAIVAPVYIVLPIAMLILIDMRPGGNLWIFFLLAVIFANDTGAFYAGKTLGRHKLYQEVSPNKTWEGAFGGIILGLIVAAVFLNIEPISIHEPDLSIVALVLVLSVASQAGDLVESMIKRSYGIKDSGSILPGHGGILDRIDGLLFAIPVMYAYVAII